MSRILAFASAVGLCAALFLAVSGGAGPDAAPLANGAAAPAAGTADAQARAARKIMTAPQYSCFTCHALGGKGGLPNEPSLDQVGNRRDAAWLATWLKDPHSIKPNTLMPKFPLSEKERATLVTYLSSLRKEIPSKQIFATAATPIERGRLLYAAYDCQACHKIGKEGRTQAPELTKVGLLRTPAKIEKWIRSPEAVKPGTFMPNFSMPDSHVTALVAYLSTLK